MTSRIVATLAFLLASLAFLVPARAGDTAALDIIGFTADGRIFAFEEYGVQDGSGFPYSTRYYIDTSNDRFLGGAPIRVVIEDEGATIADARRQTQQQGEAVVRENQLRRNPGYTAAFNAVTELSADPFRIAVNPRPVHPPIDDSVEFRIQEISVQAPDRCRSFDNIVGMRIIRVSTTPGGRTELRHEDSRIPLSRGCPTGYRIGGLQTFYPNAGRPVYALLIAIRRVGFEGPDFRWIAATGRL